MIGGRKIPSTKVLTVKNCRLYSEAARKSLSLVAAVLPHLRQGRDGSESCRAKTTLMRSPVPDQDEKPSSVRVWRNRLSLGVVALWLAGWGAFGPARLDPGIKIG